MKFFTLSLALSSCLFYSCKAQDQETFTRSEKGLEYKFVSRGGSDQEAKAGDFAELHLKFYMGDSLIINTAELNEAQPVIQPLSEPGPRGDLMEGLLMMKAGDSAVFRLSLDSMAASMGQPLPPFAKAGDFASWEVRMVNVYTKEQMEKRNLEKEEKQKKIDADAIAAYLKANKIKNAQRTASGLHYVVHEAGTGEKPQSGQKVTVNYTGTNLEGDKFDSNTDPAFNHVEPFTFTLGKGQVIKGWDEGVAQLSKGSKATLYIPSHLAYGERGAGAAIPPNAVLIFDIELLSFE